MDYIKTKAGLPNTCSKCGAPIMGEWYAESIDHARSGLGLCAKCAGKSEQAQKPRRKRKSTRER